MEKEQARLEFRLCLAPADLSPAAPKSKAHRTIIEVEGGPPRVTVCIWLLLAERDQGRRLTFA
jgi:hypothetical protein